MANICSYAMRVRGDKENIRTFYNWLSSSYNYDDENRELQVYRIKDGVNHWEVKEEDKIPSEHHIGYRVFDAWIDDDIDDIESGEYLRISGDCAWSVLSCMFDGEHTYMGDISYGRKTDRVISITDASKELNLEIEIFSEEPGCTFSEHFYIKNGEVIVNECVDFYELWLEYFDKDSESFEEEAYNELTDDFKELVDKAIADGEDYLTKCENIDEDGNYKWEYIVD